MALYSPSQLALKSFRDNNAEASKQFERRKECGFYVDGLADHVRCF